MKPNFVISLLACAAVVTYIKSNNKKQKKEMSTQDYIDKANLLSDSLERKILEKQYENNTINNHIKFRNNRNTIK